MVDVAVNNVPSLNVHDSLDPVALAADNSRWTKPEYFHEHCWIDYNNVTSVEQWYVSSDSVLSLCFSLTVTAGSEMTTSR